MPTTSGDKAMKKDHLKILIVDDNLRMRRMMRSYLQDLAGEFLECDDGAGARAAYGSFLPDIVLMDWEMKEMDGIEATREILREFPDADILIVTQFDDAELRAEARAAGARGFVPKDDLLTLRTMLRR